MKDPSKNIHPDVALSQPYKIINKIKAKLEAPNPNVNECQIQNEIPKSKTLNLFQGKVQNDIAVIPNQVLNLIQDLRISHLI
jgi:hypothetical protein